MRFLAILATLLIGTTTAYAKEAEISKIVVYPLEAIEDSGKLTHNDFKQRYPGIDVTAYGLTDVGFYVKYAHEQMLYLFGPTADVDYVRSQKATLEQVRLAAVLKNPNLSTSAIEIIHFDFADGNTSGTAQNPYLIREDEKDG